VQDTLEGKLDATECESGNVEVQWNNIKKCVLDTMCDLIGKVDSKARKPWTTQEIIKKKLMKEMEECKQLGRNEELQKTGEGIERATDKTKKEYL